MSRVLTSTLLVHAVTALLFGAPLLLAPGRFLTWLGWVPIDPILSRILVGAVLMPAWSSYSCAQAANLVQIAITRQTQIVVGRLGAIGVQRNRPAAQLYPLMVWVLLGVLGPFATVCSS